MKVQFKQWMCDLSIRISGTIVRLDLVLAQEDPTAGVEGIAVGPVATATARLDYWIFDPGEVAIKEYFENEGMVAALVAANIILPPHMHLDLRGSRVPGPRRVAGPEEAEAYVAICRLTEEVRAKYPELQQLFADDEDFCDECDEYVPSGTASHVNNHHGEGCSLHPANSA